ncbi:MAG: 16S rRNA (cytosine(1402)-N(4))-methyltransferase [Candidatus Kerfeldbacteria bacterium RIFCSPHIGHO2_02_FULL_42_14]|uniref:Ribosomal RNA small subunit methyltransferase H n=1 Tax=Candidatus Kerfeldbacteria bacterium RIFCSPHIGHO2_02_FULL_42_14 TaxID=1798540 RepID=A0A1G2AN99_9BACT|nr:MAG: 16S rRNA (cytosine(1402)-N(4))-methyltransferase [Candidatus Kerfeldbacteria bacterium RIFCSPHIGHO2_02_FULL_42_14]OGY81124.1 MAG: 16S rRNA (cytosine(1402)-N(4))-methyltransferase [Candidatus Kerfeldbacteria bacterium RIFCSPHIGHO2_12_FULL_42_13]OGY84204.1 MAG: 16S rRNA (cytosine(1402)-N(4))-methyltransferase [Candidatus Kerfeldbacteria bacterium RIFCSPLOWO2_02_FULL_42_19]OGY87479.1 MAG: 16S rRNA (cytosine(1402)-N(4))-methyltransferase [Candidatus Kerfeldbacteria bacterium RIFCSPLOWO2_12_F
MKLFQHTPVLLQEVIHALNLKSGDNVIDGTIGGGGHAEAILQATTPNGKLLGIDLDPDAIQAAKRTLREYKDRFILEQGSFADIKLICEANASYMQNICAILLDLGVSSYQFENKERGFSFQATGPLDMRFWQSDDPKNLKENRALQTLSAERIINTWSEAMLAKIFKEYGEERYARLISRAIINERKRIRIETTKQLADIVKAVYMRKSRARQNWRIHPATRTFQALRIAVNDELHTLETALPQAVEILKVGGRLAVISFHSLEDRIVKHFFQKESKDCLCPSFFPACRCQHAARLKIITKKPITSSENEQRANPRSRSAKLRVALKIK